MKPESKASLKLKAAAKLKAKRQAAADAAAVLRVEHEEAAEQHERAAQAAEQLRIHMAEEAKAAAAFERELANQEHFAEMAEESSHQRFNDDPDWIKRKAEQEDGCSVSVGGSLAKPSWWQRFKNWLSNEG